MDIKAAVVFEKSGKFNLENLEISDPKGRFEPARIGIIRAHLEEDAGKSMHDEAAGKAESGPRGGKAAGEPF